MAIGPEGGFEPRELTLAQEAGYLPVRLGSRILRTETAGLAALATLQAACRRFPLTARHRTFREVHMGLLDSILQSALGQGQGSFHGSLLSGGSLGGSPAAHKAVPILLQLALQMLAGGAGTRGGSGGSGGLMDLIQQFQQAGLGQQVNSWIATGQNLPISPEQLTQVFGRGQLQQMAASSGMDLGQLSGGLSDLLPQLIDRVTPQRPGAGAGTRRRAGRPLADAAPLMARRSALITDRTRGTESPASA